MSPETTRPRHGQVGVARGAGGFVRAVIGRRGYAVRMRFKVSGTRPVGMFGAVRSGSRYLNAASAGSAWLKAYDFDSIREVREVPDAEGRGLAWRFWHRLRP